MMTLDTEGLKLLFSAGLPIWILMTGGLACLLVDALVKRGTRWTYLMGVITLLAALGFAFNQWLVAKPLLPSILLTDRLTLYFVVIFLFIGLITLLNTFSYLELMDSENHAEGLAGAMVSLLIFSLVGGIFLFASNSLVLIFIGLETLSLAVYILVGSQKNDVRANESAIKYFVLGSVASAVFLYGMALCYGAFGSLNLSEMNSAHILNPLMAKLGMALLLSGLFFKMAIVPFHHWVPDVYEGSPAPITGFMATGVKLAAFALFVRILISADFLAHQKIIFVLTIAVIITLAVGNFGALIQDSLKRMLAYSSISHAGFLLLGLVVGLKNGAFDPAVIGAVLFYLLVYSCMTLGAFAILSVMIQDKKEVAQFSDLIGLGYQRPFLAGGLALFMLSLLGIPPTAGFMAKYGVLSFAIQHGHYGLAIVGVIASIISAYYYLKVLVMMYFRGEPQRGKPQGLQERNYPVQEIPAPLMFSIVACAVAVIYLGLYPIDYLKLTSMATEPVGVFTSQIENLLIVK